MTLQLGRRHAAIGVGAAAVAIAMAFTPPFEGLRHTVYHDVAGVQTYCYGETSNPQPGHYYSTNECNRILQPRIEEFDRGVRACTHAPIPAKSEAAFVDFAYNLGTGTYCHYIAPLVNAGQLAAACHRLTDFNHAAGKVYRGLTIRRGKEEALCLEGAS